MIIFNKAITILFKK